jgi:hypothetical protein
MSRNSAGTYTLPLPPVVAGETIEADWANGTLDDVSQALTDSLDRYGRGGMLVPFKFVDGVVAAPGMSFTNEPTSGFYREATGIVALALQGVQAWKATAAGLTAKEFFSTAAPTSGSSLVSKDYVTSALVPYQLAATAWNTGNFDPATKQNVSTAWNTGNFNPNAYALLNGTVTFNAVYANLLYSYGTVRAGGQVRGSSIIATPAP